MSNNNLLTREDIIAPVNGEVDCIHSKDFEKMFTYFSRDIRFEDPAGTGPFDGKGKENQGPVRRFFKAVVAPTEFTYVKKMEIVAGMDVVRDVEATIKYENGAEIVVDTHVIYHNVIEDGEVKIRHVFACWESDSLKKQFFDLGLYKATQLSMSMMRRLIKIAGMKDMLKYFKDLRTGILDEGRNAVNRFVNAVNSRNQASLEILFDTADPVIQFPVNSKTCSVKDFFECLEKDSTISVFEVTPASWYTSCIFEILGKTENTKGFAFFHFNPVSRKIDSISFYWE